MKIAVPIDERGTDPVVASSFGRAAYYLVYDEKAEIQLLENEASQSAGGAGIKAAQTVVDSGAEVLLTPQCGQNAAKVLLAGGVKLHKTKPDLSAIGNIQAFLRGETEELYEIHAGFHRHK